MKKILSYLTVSFAALLLFSCEIDKVSNGQLDGFWKLCTIDTLQGGSQDLMDQRLFWSVQAHLLYMQDIDHENTYIFRFERSDDSLFVHHPYLYDKRKGDVLLTEPDSLELFGLYDLSESYYVEYLSHNHMRLLSSAFRLHFRKF